MKNISIAFIAIFFASFHSDAQQKVQIQTTSIEIIQFHSEHRCITCQKIEKLTRATLATYFPGIPFSLVNVDDKKNANKAEQFQASGTALFLYNPNTGKKKDLTDFAFMKAGDDKEFEAELKKYIEDFIKG
jgi:hypothetical protein